MSIEAISYAVKATAPVVKGLGQILHRGFNRLNQRGRAVILSLSMAQAAYYQVFQADTSPSFLFTTVRQTAGWLLTLEALHYMLTPHPHHAPPLPNRMVIRREAGG